MRAVATLVILGVLAMRLDGPATLIAQDRPIPKSADSKSTDGVKDIVATFFKNWKQGQATRNQSLFVNADIPVVGFGPDHRPGQLTAVRQKTAEHVLKEWEANPPQYLVTDSIEVDRLGGSLAAARVTYSGFGSKGRAVFTLYSEAGTWRIASLVLDTRINW